MGIAVVFIVVGLGLLMFGADRFVDGAAALAANLGVPPLLVGLTVVGFGTSAPELLVAASASFAGNPSIAVGNAIGSNIANIGLVLGVTALVMPLAVHSRVLKQEFPIMFAAMLLALLLFWDGHLDRQDGLYLVAGLFVMMGLTTWLGLRAGRNIHKGDNNDFIAGETKAPEDALPVDVLVDELEIPVFSTKRALMLSFIGLVCLIIGADRLVSGAVTIATHFGVSELVIGLTIVAIGTSLPELAASVASALKGESDIALGNVIGSNMFNILGVTAAPALILPSVIEPAVISRDLPIMFGLSIAIYFMSMGKVGQITRVGGFFLLAAFISYQYVLYGSTAI